MPKKRNRNFPTGAITCPCGRTLSPNMQTCRGCGADRPVYGPAPASEGRAVSPQPPASSSKKLTDFEKKSDKIRRATPDGLVSYKDRMKPKDKESDDEH